MIDGKQDPVDPTLDILLLTYKSDDDVSKNWTQVPAILPNGWNLRVRDNGGTWNSLKRMQTKWSNQSNFSVVYADNVGFGKGINALASSSDAKYLAIVNPDAVLELNALQKLVDALEEAPGLCAIGPRLVDEFGDPVSDARRLPSLLDIALRRPTAEPAGRLGVQKVGWICGAFMVWKRAAFTQLAGFDEKYFMFWEDVDLCRRAPGGTIAVHNGVTAVHRVGGSHGGSVQSQRISRTSRSLYAAAAFGARGRVACALADVTEWFLQARMVRRFRAAVS